MRLLHKTGLRTTTLLLIIGSISLLFASTSGRTGQPAAIPERDSLRGVVGVEVRVEPIAIEIEELGLPTDKLQNEVQQRLQEAGINLFTERERLASSTGGLLNIHVDALHDRIGRFFYTIDLSFMRPVRLKGLDHPDASAVTWMNLGEVGSIADDNVTYLQEQVLRKVDHFIKDYRAANPTRRGSNHRTKP
jgi:hypothetical protein